MERYNEATAITFREEHSRTQAGAQRSYFALGANDLFSVLVRGSRIGSGCRSTVDAKANSIAPTSFVRYFSSRFGSQLWACGVTMNVFQLQPKIRGTKRPVLAM
jgi:hypothetical protein